VLARDSGAATTGFKISSTEGKGLFIPACVFVSACGVRVPFSEERLASEGILFGCWSFSAGLISSVSGGTGSIKRCDRGVGADKDVSASIVGVSTPV
jgi:hypothetical protein